MFLLRNKKLSFSYPQFLLLSGAGKSLKFKVKSEQLTHICPFTVPSETKFLFFFSHVASHLLKMISTTNNILCFEYNIIIKMQSSN